MPRSATRRRKQPTRRPVQPAARAARLPLPAPPPESEDVVEDADEWDDQDEDDAEAPEPDEGEQPSRPTSARGMVRTATWRRGRVPYLLQDVVEACVVVTAAERDLAKKVRAARNHGATWEDIGLALGMTRQGATKRFG